MRNHPIGGAKTVWYRLIISQQDFTDFNECKIVLTQCIESLLYLIESGDKTTQKSTGLEHCAHLRDIVIWIRHIEEERVRVNFVEALLNIAQFEIHARIE